MTDHDLPGPLPHICTLKGRQREGLTEWLSHYFFKETMICCILDYKPQHFLKTVLTVADR